LAHTLNIEIPGVDNKWLTLKMKGFCFATGSACSTLNDEPSHVLLAMGLNERRTHNCIRIGVGIDTTEEDINLFAEELKLHI
jgi:cysteine desulfurase